MVVFKHRYMLFEIFVNLDREGKGEDEVTFSEHGITLAIKQSLEVNFGEYGLAASLNRLQVQYFNPITKLCVVRCLRREHQKVWCAITLITSIGRCSAFFNLLDLNGSIRASRKYALKYDKAKFEQYKLMQGDRQSEETLKLVYNCFEKLKNLA
ncbi:probable ribonuclease P/MRP protein subunit POP5 [Cryptomeria japonica]|uniref:probable ribonuclease P/MRP protein subunit POP5 n=1 Tax=Cryptomeria japonica TaxID=3369 RepID=UPI0027DA86D4|nr:probable ribonuclease P/MRP protein subunit POP5 [Cryptomeria japonica]